MPALAEQRRFVWQALAITAVAMLTRMAAALCFPDDSSDDSAVYLRLGRNLLEHHVYSSEIAAPYVPNYFRMPGYPLLLAAAQTVFGSGASTAVRVLQALADTCTCWLAALLAYVWSPAGWSRARRRLALLATLASMALCPFVAIYVTTLLTEVLTTTCWMAAILLGSLALQRRGRWLWAASGLACGTATLLRPDSGLLLAAIGGTLALTGIARAHWRQTVVCMVILAGSFGAVLAPWTVRNALVFDRFMPIPPRYPNLNGDMEGLGYRAWLRTWVDDFRYVSPFEWQLGSEAISIEQVPSWALDSAAEKQRVAKLLNRYSHPLAGSGDAAASAPQMSADIDAEFALLAVERSARHPLRTYLLMPARRALALWFDTHSDYYSFAGPLFPWSQLSPTVLALRLSFVVLTWLITLGSALGAGQLWRARDTRRWLLLAGAVAIPRLLLLSMLENPEPRYMVELFPMLLSMLGVGAVAALMQRDWRAASAPRPRARWRRPTRGQRAPLDAPGAVID